MTRGAGIDSGFTLIEVLVALVLFSLIGLAGFTMLDTILRVRAGTEARLERLAEIDRALVVFSRDIQQRTRPEVTYGDDGLSFTGAGGRQLVYRVSDGNLLRGLAATGDFQVLLATVESMTMQFLDRERAWQSAWPPDERGGALQAVEMTLWLPSEAGPSGARNRVVRLVDLPMLQP